jgi:hypothetical protein
MSNIYYITRKNTLFHNIKSFDLITIYFKNNYIHLELDLLEAMQFISNNNNEYTKIIIPFMHYDMMDEYYLHVLFHIKNNDIKSKIFIITQDWWKITNDHYQNFLINNVFKATNYKVLTFAYDIEQLNSFHNDNFNDYSNNIISINMWSAYGMAFNDFNNRPIEKILVSGCINDAYPERETILMMNNIFHYEYNMNDVWSNNNNYNKMLNSYLCCFTSSVYVINHSNNTRMNTNMILLKTFEILASGSLLLMPKCEEEYIKMIGLIDRENCILLDFDKDINNMIDFIFDSKNREYIDKIRYNGYNHCKNNLTTDIIFNKIHNIICEKDVTHIQ